VEDTAILNVGVGADADGVHVAAENGVHPDAGVLAEDYVSNDLGRVVYVAGGWDGGPSAFVGTNHIFEKITRGAFREEVASRLPFSFWQGFVLSSRRRLRVGKSGIDEEINRCGEGQP